MRTGDSGAVFSRPFASPSHGMMPFLKRLARLPSPYPTFVARNFLLEEGASARRFESYSNLGAVADHVDYPSWLGAHEVYLTERIWRPNSGTGPPLRIDPDDDSCPETFREVTLDSPYHAADAKLDLVRVERVDFIAERSGETSKRVKSLAQAVMEFGNDSARDESRLLSDVLDAWLKTLDLRPVFAGFWDNLHDLFGPTHLDDIPGWADQLRDRLGLLHLDPGPLARDAVDVLVFRYPISLVPKFDRGGLPADSRPIVPPTVLDSRHSIAFCPAPHGEPTGYTIDLDERVPPLHMEVLHPNVMFKSQHMWRLGTIARPVDPDRLAKARGMHLYAICDQCGREDYGMDTDADLLL